MTFPIAWTSSSVLEEMELCCMRLRSSRYSAASFEDTLCVFFLLVWHNSFVLPCFTCRIAFHQLWPSTWAPWASWRLSNLTPTSLRSPKLSKVLNALQPVSQPRAFCSADTPVLLAKHVLCSSLHLRKKLLIPFCVLYSGNAAIVLRSRLKVRVLKENWEKKARMDDNGIILTNGDTESSRKAMQYQVVAAP